MIRIITKTSLITALALQERVQLFQFYVGLRQAYGKPS